MKPLLLTFSCARDRVQGHDQAVRETWLGKWGALLPQQFVYGRGNAGAAGLVVDADDSWHGLMDKQRSAYAWFLEQSYDFLFVSHTDTYVHIPRLLASGFEQHDYSGYKDAYRCFCEGGAGYWLSRRACAALVRAKQPFGPADLSDGIALARVGILPHRDTRYDSEITLHLGRETGVYEPQWMFDAHARMTMETR